MAKILFFGRLSDLSGPLDLALPDGVKTTDDLAAWLGERYPNLQAALARNDNRIAVNKIMSLGAVTVSDHDEIAFMSPLSGG